MANLGDFPLELLEEVLIDLPYDELPRHGAVSPLVRDLLRTEAFWIRRAQLLLGVSREEFNDRWEIERYLPLQDLPLGGIGQSRYVELVCRQQKVVAGGEYFLFPEECFNRAIEQNDNHLIAYFRGDQVITAEHVKIAFRAGNLDFFYRHLEQFGPNYTETLGAYFIGYSGLDILLRTVDQLNEELLEGLLSGGHMEQAKTLFQRDPRWPRVALNGAITSGRPEIIEETLRYFGKPDRQRSDADQIRAKIVKSGSLDVVETLQKHRYYREGERYLETITEAARSGHIELLYHFQGINARAFLSYGSQSRPAFRALFESRYNLEGVHFLFQIQMDTNFETFIDRAKRGAGDFINSSSRAVEAFISNQ